MFNSATTTEKQSSSAVPTAWSYDTHRRTHYSQQQRDIKLEKHQHQLCTLLSELQLATNHWFQTKNDDSFQLLVQTCQQILQHGLLHPTNIGSQRLFEDFEHLRLAGQQLTPVPTTLRIVASSVSDFLQQWIARCLRESCLSHCMQSLVADREMLNAYYQRDVAYLRQSGYSAALFVCLTAIELDQSSLLSQLERVNRCGRHRRISSQPNFSITHRLHVVQEDPEDLNQQCQQQRQQLSLLQHYHLQPFKLLRRIKSLPCLYQGDDNSYANSLTRPRCQTLNESPREGCPLKLSGCSVSSTASSCSQVSLPRHIQLINCDSIKIWTDQTNSSNSCLETTTTPTAKEEANAAASTKTRTSPFNSFLSNLFGSPPLYTSWYSRGLGQDDKASSVLDNFLPINGRKLNKRQHQSLFEGISMLDDTNQCQVDTNCIGPTAPLDILGPSTSTGSTTSCSLSSESQHSSGNNKLDNQSFAAFLQMSRYTHNNTELEKENAHFRISEACIAAIEHVKWSRHATTATTMESASISCAADMDTMLMPIAEQHNTKSSSNMNNNNSAEAVGLQLISRFNDQQLPKLGDLKWLVSEQDTPQQLLPLPLPKPEEQQQQKQLPSCDNAQAGLTRGTKTWAPPRQQIIFTEHASTSRTQLLVLQHYLCAGCGMHVTRQYQHHFRYCNYLGKYMCTGCHRNQLSALPAKILQSWDFRCYAVSSFAYRLIEQMYTFPLFHVPDLNAQLYVKQRVLVRARRRRQQLKYVRDFIAACRFAIREQSFFNAIPAHITNDPDMWSLCDFVDVQNTSMSRSIEELITLNEQHVYSCVLCTGRGFVCELCKSHQLIYPWQRKVHRCDQCGACSHSNCWKSKRADNCLRCERLQGRKQLAS